MTHLDLLLSLVRITAVASIALGFGLVLLRRRPESVPALVLTSLLSGCTLMVLTGASWPTVWHATVPVEPSTAADDSRIPISAATEAPAMEFSWDQFARVMRRLDTDVAQSSTISVQGVLVLIGVLLFLGVARVVIGATATLLLHRNSCPVTDERLTALVGQLSAGGLTFRVTSRIDAPCVTVIDGQTIYLPDNWSDYSDDELLASVAHEVAHLTRRDARWRLLAQLATSLQYFHPMAHGLLRQLVIGQELAADGHAARLIGLQRFIRGISQLALRLDASANVRSGPAIGMSHSSSFLIRRITMLRNGMPDADRRISQRASRVMVLGVLAAAVVSASWKLSAEEPVRVAARPVGGDSTGQEKLAEPWQLLPGRTGYWSVNLEAVWKDPMMAQWLNTAELAFLTPGWKVIASEDAADRRSELGLTLSNVQAVGGELTMKTERIDDPESEERFRSTVKSSELVLHLRKQVNWTSVADALARDRLDAAIAGLVGREFPEKAAQEIIDQDMIGRFFRTQTDSHRFIFRQDLFKAEPEEERPATAQAIPKLWNAYRGELATMVTVLPETAPPGDTEFEKLLEAFPKSAEYYIVSIDPSEQPGHVQVRLGFSPRGKTTLQDLQSRFAALTKSAREHFAATASDDESEPDGQALQNFLETATPKIVSPKQPDGIGIVEIKGEVPVTALPFVVAG